LKTFTSSNPCTSSNEPDRRVEAPPAASSTARLKAMVVGARDMAPRSSLLVTLALAACSASPPPPPPSPPAVAVASAEPSPPPPPPSAAPAAEEEAPPDRAQACAEEASAAFSADHPTLDSCGEMAMKLHEIASRCDEDMMQTIHLRNGAYARCVEGVEEKALEKRIEALGSDRAAIDREKKAQEIFVREVEGACRCYDGPSARHAACQGALHAERTGWLVQANAGALELGGKKDAEERKRARKAKAKVLAPLAPFAKALCASPKGAWKGGKAPAGCPDEVLGALGATLVAMETQGQLHPCPKP
jgi:hypothetical protein